MSENYPQSQTEEGRKIMDLIRAVAKRKGLPTTITSWDLDKERRRQLADLKKSGLQK